VCLEELKPCLTTATPSRCSAGASCAWRLPGALKQRSSAFRGSLRTRGSRRSRARPCTTSTSGRGRALPRRVRESRATGGRIERAYALMGVFHPAQGVQQRGHRLLHGGAPERERRRLVGPPGVRPRDGEGLRWSLERVFERAPPEPRQQTPSVARRGWRTCSRPNEVALYTFGCKLNQYETKLCAGFPSVRARGRDRLGGGDLYVVNTCRSPPRASRRRAAYPLARPRSPTRCGGYRVLRADRRRVDPRAGRQRALPSPGEKHLLLELGERLQSREAGPRRTRGGSAGALDASALLPGGSPSPSRWGTPASTACDAQDPGRLRLRLRLLPRASARGPLRVPRWAECSPKRGLWRAPATRDRAHGGNIAAYRADDQGSSPTCPPLLAETRLVRCGFLLEPERIRGAPPALADERVCHHFHSRCSRSDAVSGHGPTVLGRDVKAAVEGLRAAKGDPFVARP